MPPGLFAEPSRGRGVLGMTGGNSAAGGSHDSPSKEPGGGEDLTFAAASAS